MKKHIGEAWRTPRGLQICVLDRLGVWKHDNTLDNEIIVLLDITSSNVPINPKTTQRIHYIVALTKFGIRGCWFEPPSEADSPPLFLNFTKIG